MSLVDYEPWEHPWEDYPAPVTGPALERRVTALEARVAALEAKEPPGFLKDCRVDVYRDTATRAVRITHLPTGIVREAATKEAAVRLLGEVLVGRGDVTLNSARAALGLPAWELADSRGDCGD